MAKVVSLAKARLERAENDTNETDVRSCGDTQEERVRNLRSLKMMLGLDAEQLEQKAQALEYAIHGVAKLHHAVSIAPLAAMVRELRDAFSHAAGVSRIVKFDAGLDRSR